MEISELIPHIESLIFASDKPLSSSEITDLVNAAFGFMEEKVSAEQIESSIDGIVEKYNSEFYPFEVRQTGGGWQFLTKKEFHKTVAQLNGEKFLKRLSSAALETLAIVAYKQPVTKGEIESIRGVSSDYAVQKLLEKELVVITGRNEKLPGHPLVYTTSKSFMDYFGINSPNDLPKIKEVLADQLVIPTSIHQSDFTVTDSGEFLTINETNGDSGVPLLIDENVEIESPVTLNEGGTESIEDEIAKEEFITDQIFVAEDEVVGEEKIEEELLQNDIDETSSYDDLILTIKDDKSKPSNGEEVKD